MSDVRTLRAEPRERAGKGASRAVRREGLVPGVVYGGGEEPRMLAIDMPQLQRAFNQGKFMSSVFEISIGDKVKERAITKDIQFHPVTDMPLHLDFFRVDMDATVTVAVQVQFTNEEKSPGLKRGGVLNVVRHEVEVVAPADAIPNELVADLSGLDFNDSLHISAITLPEGVTPAITDRDFTVATIAAPSGGAEDGEEGEGGGEAEG